MTRESSLRTLVTGTAIVSLMLGITTTTRAQSCPLPEGTLGYPVVASSAEPVDQAFLAELASASAYRWRVPSGRRATYTGWDRVRDRVRTPEPRWADDWEPAEKHRARMTIVVHRDGRVRRAGDIMASGDRAFDRSLPSIVDEPMPKAPRFPRLPASHATDSAVITLAFGDEAATTSAGAGIARFAAQQLPVRLVKGSMHIVAPRDVGTPSARSRRATVKYDVTAEGVVDRGSIEIIESSDPELTRAIEEALQRAQFTPAQSNCRSIAQSVIQAFGQ